MQKKLLITVSKDAANERLDAFAASYTGVARSSIVKLIECGNITVNGNKENKNYKLREMDSISIDFPEPEKLEAQSEDIPLDTVYEDESIIVVNKPSGMVVHPAAGNHSGTLVNALLYKCADSLSGIGGKMRPGIVHRIDKDTSGLLVVAKNDIAHLALSEQLKTHEISRIYHAIIIGHLKDDAGVVNAPIGRSLKDRKKMAVVDAADSKSRNAVTHYKVIENFNGFSYIQCELETGRTHQIRVHMSYLGHPIIGDPLYGGDKTKFQSENKTLFLGQCLHAKELRFVHPITGENMHFECPLPENMELIIKKLRAQSR